MVQLKRKVKIKQKKEPHKPKPFLSKKTIAYWALAGLIVAGGGSYAIHKYNTKSTPIAPKTNDSVKSKTLIIDSESQDTSFQTSMPEKKIQIEEKSDLNNNNVYDIETAALSVIRGDYGNNPIRKRRLGDRYQEIQKRVNQMYREGKVRKRF